jgi:hypothetical protein
MSSNIELRLPGSVYGDSFADASPINRNMRILSHFWASDAYGVSDADAFDDVRASFFMACAYQNESIG